MKRKVNVKEGRESKLPIKEENVTKLQFYHALDGIIQPGTSNYVRKPLIQKRAVELERKAAKATSMRVLTRTKIRAKGAQKQPEAVVIKSSNKKEIVPTKEKHFTYSAIDTIESARSGIKFSDFKNIYNLLGLTNNKWAEIIGTSDRTMQNILKEKRDLDQNKSEKLLSFLTLVEYALEVLGDETNFKEWLNYKSPSLNGMSPIEFVDTFQGIDMLREQLFKIETGNFV